MNQIVTETQRQQFDELGYMIVRNAIDATLIRSASAAVERILDRAMAGEFGEDFRWILKEQRLPEFLNDLLSPEKYDPAFGDVLEFALLPFIESLLQKPVWCSWLILLTGGAGHAYGVPLHRDNNKTGGDDELEFVDQFRRTQCYIQAPLMAEDNFLQLVPGSHLRTATAAETAIANSDSASQDVAGLITIQLRPGDVVFRQSHILHQGWNPEGRPRGTLVSAFWAADMPVLPIERQHYPTLTAPSFVERLPPRVRASVERYIAAYERSSEESTEQFQS